MYRSASRIRSRSACSFRCSLLPLSLTLTVASLPLSLAPVLALRLAGALAPLRLPVARPLVPMDRAGGHHDLLSGIQIAVHPFRRQDRQVAPPHVQQACRRPIVRETSVGMNVVGDELLTITQHLDPMAFVAGNGLGPRPA